MALALLSLGAPSNLARAATIAQFHLRTNDGYKVEVGSREATVFLEVEKATRSPRRVRAFSSYFARGAASSTAIKARFGELGSVDMRFRPSGVVRKKQADACPGAKPTVTRYGVFVGSIRFRGEGGYVSVRAHRAVGAVVSLPSLSSCIAFSAVGSPTGRISREGGSGRTLLEAGALSAVSGTLFMGIGYDDRALYLAERERTEGSLAFFRAALVRAPPLTFTSDDALSFASVSPPAPFSGTASLQRNPDGTKSWMGSLAVSFLGEPDVPLAGEQFTTRLARSWPRSTYKPESSPPRLRVALISRLLALVSPPSRGFEAARSGG